MQQPPPPPTLPTPPLSAHLVTPPWIVRKSKAPSQAPLPLLQEYCTALGLQFQLEDPKRVLYEKIEQWKKHQSNLKEQIRNASRPPKPLPVPRKRPAPAPTPKTPKTPVRTPTSRLPLSPSTSPNTLTGLSEVADQIQEILDENLEETLAQIAQDKTSTPEELEQLAQLGDFDEEEGEKETRSKDVPSIAFDEGVARLLRLVNTNTTSSDELTPNEAMMILIRSEIQEGRRPGAIRTEHAILKPFAKWIDEQIASGQLEDDIVDENTAMKYLRYSSTRPLLDSHQRVKEGKGQLSASSIKKIGTMLNRVRKAQVTAALLHGIELDRTRPLAGLTLVKFINHLKIEASRHARMVAAKDVTDGTILEYGTWGTEHMQRLLRCALNGRCTPTVIKTSFFLAWTTQSLMRLDDLQSLGFAYLQPWIFRQGRNVDRDHFCLVTLSYEGKNLSHKPIDEAAYTFLIPHRVPELCAIGHLAAHLQFLFDQTRWHERPEFLGKSEEWDWFKDSSFRKVRLLPGTKAADKPAAGSAISKQIALNLEACEMASKSKAHLGRKIGCVE